MTNNVTAGSSLNAGSRQNLHHLTQLSQNKRMFLRLWTRSLTFKGHNILSVLLTFRTFTAELSGIAAISTPGIRCVLLSSSTPTLAIRQW